jgi:hypothetical protein
MTHSKRIKIGCAAMLLSGAGSLSACGNHDGFDTSSQANFVNSCQVAALNVAVQLRDANSASGVTPSVVAAFFSVYAVPLPNQSIDRDFNPADNIPVAGFERLTEPSVVKSCELAAAQVQRFNGVTAVEAYRLGISNEISALSSQADAADALREEILDRQTDARQEAIKLRQLMDQYAPKGMAFQIANVGGAYVPSIAIDAANVVGRPITAFLMTISLVGWNGTPIGVGRVRFVPPVPLGPGVESTYVLNLINVRGIDTPSVISYSGALKVIVTLDDLIVEGRPLLQDLNVEAGDKVRVDALDVLESTVIRYRQQIDLIRQNQIAAFG